MESSTTLRQNTTVFWRVDDVSWPLEAVRPCPAVYSMRSLRFYAPCAPSDAGLLYEAMSGPIFIGMLNAISLFPAQRDLFYRESRDGLYGAGSFQLGYTLHAMPPTSTW